MDAGPVWSRSPPTPGTYGIGGGFWLGPAHPQLHTLLNNASWKAAIHPDAICQRYFAPALYGEVMLKLTRRMHEQQNIRDAGAFWNITVIRAFISWEMGQLMIGHPTFGIDPTDHHPMSLLNNSAPASSDGFTKQQDIVANFFDGLRIEARVLQGAVQQIAQAAKLEIGDSVRNNVDESTEPLFATFDLMVSKGQVIWLFLTSLDTSGTNIYIEEDASMDDLRRELKNFRHSLPPQFRNDVGELVPFFPWRETHKRDKATVKTEFTRTVAWLGLLPALMGIAVMPFPKYQHDATKASPWSPIMIETPKLFHSIPTSPSRPWSMSGLKRFLKAVTTRASQFPYEKPSQLLSYILLQSR